MLQEALRVSLEDSSRYIYFAEKCVELNFIKVDSDNRLVLDVRQSHIVLDAMRGACKTKFDPKRPVKVEII